MRVPHDNEALSACKAPMTLEELLDSFTFAEDLPDAALREASARRTELAEPFVAEIERWIADTDSDPDEPSPLFFLVHLLGAWREKRAYELICRMLRSDPDRLEAALGDAITETVPRIIVTLCDGDWAPIREVIEDDEADEFARSSMVEALGALVAARKVPRDEVVDYLRQLPARIDLPAKHPLWGSWALLISDLKARELRSDVVDAFSRKLIPTEIVSRSGFIEEIDSEAPSDYAYAAPFSDDVVAELAETFDWEGAEAPAEPIVNPYRRVGRNDPCPCGSGKKFKRCHGA
jgi:hypothetical protein